MKRIFTLSVSSFVTKRDSGFAGLRNVATLILLALTSQLAYAQTPSTQANNIVFSPNGSATALSISWSGGDGSNSLVVIYENGGVFTPVDAVNYNADVNSVYSSAVNKSTGIGTARIVYNGAANTALVTGLSGATYYTVKVFEFNSTGFLYNTTSATNNPVVGWFYANTGATTDFNVPGGVTSLNVKAWGAGGGAGATNANATRSCNGGGGGAFAGEVTLGVSAGSTHTVTIGSGGAGSANSTIAGGNGGLSSFGSLVIANGGSGSAADVGGGAGGTIGTNTTKFPGGAGGNRLAGQGGGGGGGSAGAGPSGTGGTGGNGTSGTGGTAGTAGPGGGAAGGAGGNPNVGGNNGTFPGGGGGGRGDSGPADSNGDGANGLVIVSYADVTAPTATIIREPATANSYNTNASVQFKVTFSETVYGVSPDGSDFTAVGGGTVTSGAITVTGTGPYIVTVATITGDGTLDLNFAGGQNITDIAHNPFGGTTAGDEIYNIDNSQPATFTVGNVVATANAGGNVVTGIYNGTNTAGLEISVDIDNDVTLIGGNIQFRIDKDGGASFNDLHTAFPISTVGTTQVFTIPHAGGTGLTNNSEYGDTRTLTFTAVITDAAGNFRTGTESVTTILVDLTGPAAPSVPDLLAGDDSGSSATDNNTNVTSPTFNSTANVAGIANLAVRVVSSVDGVIGTSTANGSGGYSISATFVSQVSHSITVVAVDAQGNIGTSTALTPVVYDNTAPSAPTVPDLTTDTGLSNSDNITNDNTPTFSATGSSGITLEILAGGVSVATAAGTGSSQNLTTSALADATHSITARSTDVAGNSTSSAALSVKIDTQAPSITSILPFTTQPTKGPILRTGTISVSAATAVTGTTTLFTTELDSGSVITTVADAALGTMVNSIASNTALTLQTNATHSGTYYERFFFTVTFNEPVTNTSVAAADFAESGVGTLGTVAPNISGTGKSQTFRVYVSGLSAATGSSQINTVGSPSYTDVAGNASATIFNGTPADIDNTAPAAQAAPTSPTAGTDISTAEEAAGVVIRVPLTSGSGATLPETGDNVRLLLATADFAPPIVYTVTNTDISNGYADITIPPGQLGGAGSKSITARVEDFAGNNGTASPALVLNVDFTNPTFTSTAPIAAATVTNANVSFTPSETLSAGSVVWTWVSGTPDGNHTVPLTGTELNTSAKTNVILVNNPTTLKNGAVYDVSFNGTDLAGNTGSVTNAGVTYNDNSNPATNTVGTLTPGPAGSTRVVAGYINSSNTNLTVRVPLDNTDGTLEGGTIQLSVQNTANAGFVDVPTSGLYTIVQADRVAGFKDVVVAKTDLALAVAGATGFAEGAVGNAAAAETRKIEINAVVKDNANNSVTYTKSAVQLDVDQTPPNLTTQIKVYDNQGVQPSGGNREVIVFRLSEDAYTSGGAVVTDNTIFVNVVDIAYGSTGFSVDDPGVGSNDVDANYVRYESDGANLSFDATVAKTRLIWIESNHNTSNWSSSASPVTKVQYVQFGATSSDAKLIRDAAGNELGAFATDVSVGDVIPPALSPNVITLFPRSTSPEKLVFTLSEALSTSTAADAVTGFSTTGTFPDPSVDIATYSEASPGVCPCTITLTSLANGNWTGATQVWYDAATGNVLDLAGVELVAFANHAVVTEAIAPSIASVSIPAAGMKVGSVVTATITVANDDGDTPTLTSGTIGGFPLTVLDFSASPTSKTVQFTVTEGGTDVASGSNIPVANLVLTDGQGNASTVFATPISQLGDPIDAHSPTITSITNTLATIYEGAKTQTVTVVYNETMNTSVQPTISLSGGSTHWGAQTASGGTNGWVGNTYTATFTHDGFEEPASDPSISVQSSVAVGGAQDAAGNPNLGTATSTAFILDTKKPTATVSVAPSTINVVNDILTVTVDFSKAMNISVAPAVSFTIGAGVSNFNPTGVGVWSNGNKRYVRSYQQLNNLTSLTNSVSVNSGQDAAGNVQTASAASSNFIIDRVVPTVVSVDRVTTQFTNLTSLQYNVTFSEAVSGLATSNFDYVVVSGSASGSVTGFSTSDNITYLVTVSVAGGSNGEIRLDVNTSGSVVDDRSNAFDTAFNTGQTYIVDTTPPTIVEIVHNPSLFNGWGALQFITTPAYNGNLVDFIITFDEEVVGLADAQIFDNVSAGSASFPGVSFSAPPTIVPVDAGGTPLAPATLPSQYWKVTYTSVAGSGYIFPHFRNVAPFVKDKAGNNEVHTASDFFGFEDGSNTRYYYVALPAPSLDVADASFIGTAIGNTSLSVQWNHSGGTQRATDYLIRAKQSNLSFPVNTNPVNGTSPANDADATDGVLVQHFNSNAWPTGPATQISTAFTGLRSGVDYDFEIYPYTISDNVPFTQSIDYQTGSPATVTVNPTTANSATLTFGGSTLPFSSITTSGPLALAHLTNFRFTITDETVDQDNAPFKFSGLVIKRNTAADAVTGQDDIGDWTLAIQTAYLVDVATGLQIDSIATITPDAITFASIPSTLNQLGYVADGGSKQYDLHIRLKKDLGTTLAATIDGLNFAFYIDNASFTLNNTYDALSNSQRSTGLVGGQLIATLDNRNQVNVVAEKLAFRLPGTPGTATEPQSQIGVATPFSAVPLASRPRVRALDRYNNLDLGYTSTATVTNSLSLTQSVSSIPFAAGVLSLDALSFNTYNVNPTLIQVAAPGVTPTASTGVTTFISNFTTITDGNTLPGNELANFTSITNTTPAAFNFDFRISDDVGADATNFTNNDGLPTLIQTITITQGSNNGDNTGGADALSFDNWTKSILGAQLKAVGNVQTVAGTVNNGSLVFNIPAGSFMENVPNDGFTDYELRIWLRNPIDSTGATNLRTILDNKDYSFAIDVSNITINSSAPNNTSTKAASGSASTADGTNVVQVHATKLKFYQHPAASQQYDAAITPSPIVWATDANGNIDNGYTHIPTAPTVATIPNGSRTYPPLAGTNTLTNTTGIITFDNTGPDVYTLTSGGGGFSGDQTRLVVSGGLNDLGDPVTTANSNIFTLNYSNSSDIVRDGTFTHPTDIPYYLNRESVSLTTGNSIPLDRFTLRDGGSTFTDSDGSKTRLQSITLNVTNHENIRLIALFDETNAKLQQLDSTAFSATGDITFGSLAVFEDDDNNLDAVLKKFTVRVSFKAFVAPGVNRDNQQMNVSLVGATAVGVSSQLTPGLTIPGDNLGTDKNKIEVVATRIDFTTVPATASISVPIAPPTSPQIVVSARDAFASLDLDYAGTITATETNPTSDLLFHTLGDPTGPFSGGQLTYPNNFQFDIGDGNVQLTINAGDNVNFPAIAGTSPIISVISSFESKINYPTGYTVANIPNSIPYVNHQAANLSDNVELIRYAVADGTGDGNADGDTPGVPGDLDGAPTVLNSLKIGVTNYTAIRSIGAYDDSGNLIVTGTITPVSGILGEAEFVFAPGNEIIAADDAEKMFSIRATFQSSPTLISDTMHIRLSLRSAILGTGSKFYDLGSYIVGNIPTNVTAPKLKNEIEVTATSLDFVTQASPYAGVKEPVGPSYNASTPLPITTAAIVHARDKFQVIDLDFNSALTSITGATTGTIDFTGSFSGGVLNLDGMKYDDYGDGKITIVANGINSSNPPGANVNAIPGQTVNVVNVSADINTNGVVSSTNIKGGTPGVVIFGVTFTPEYATPAEPSLKGFTFRFTVPFKTPAATIFKNWLVTESQSGTYGGSTDVTISGATVTEAASSAAGPGEFDMIIVDWGSNPPRELFDDQNPGNVAPRTYYLVADADVTANISTPSITPYLLDQGYGTLSDDNIITTAGTAIARFNATQGTNIVLGQPYSFASTRPPVLLSAKENLTRPYNGQLNVDPAISQIALEFDVEVWSFDGSAEIYDRTNNTKIANLTVPNHGTAGSGWYSDGSSVSPLLFDINLLPGKSMKPDSVYYVTIKKGSFDNGTNSGTGISDDGFNFYGGIAYNGGLYFKISSPNPPKLTSALAGGANTFINKTMGSFSAVFDQAGTGYYMVIDRARYLTFNGGLGNAPDTAAIRTPTTYMFDNPNSVVSTGSFPITQINELQHVSFVPNHAPYIVNGLAPGSVYDIWVFAKNDALPTRIGTHYPYGDAASGYDFVNFVEKPTVQFTVPASPRNINQPTYLLCPDSYVTLTNPIVISEATATEFQLATAQDFYILLPPGFQFDGITKPTVTVNGADFTPSSLQVVFVNNTIVRVSYSNTGGSSLDNIIITDLRMLGLAGSVPGDIKRFAGNAVLPAIPASNKLATVSLKSTSLLKFTNSYSEDNEFPAIFFSSNSIITAIPDNYVDKDPSLSGAIRLIPKITPANDYGASFFTGTGVTNDVLNLGAVALNSAFDITMTHADMNGCVIETAVQHVVYDHNSPISTKLGLGIAPLGTNQTLKNPNFQTNAALPPNYVTPPVFAPDNASLPKIVHNDLAGYELLELFADTIANASNQIIYGPDWQELVSKIPVWVKRTITQTAPQRNNVPGTNYVQDFQWDYSHILNAVPESDTISPLTPTTITMDPYDHFKSTVATTQGNFYWKGGSLGKIQFTGIFQNQADLQVIVPFRQQVELFVPPIPIIEASNHSFNFDPVGLRGTAVYCQNQLTVVQLNGFPFAVPGASTGYFVLRDSANISAIIHNAKDPNLPITINANFTDAGNGSASFIAGNITNSYKTIRVDYTYQDVGAPESATATFYIRITPNPVADFSATSQLTKRKPVSFGRPIGTNSYCEDNWITFTNASTFAVATDPNQNSRPYLPNTSAAWDLGDLSNISSNIDTVSHIYDVFGKYDVKFQVSSQFNCPSTQVTKSIIVGAKPVPSFTMDGISTATPINVADVSTVPSGNGSGSATLAANWYFGVPAVSNPDPTTTTFTSTGNNTYAAPGHYTITLLARSQITTSGLPGCEITYQRPVIIVPALSATTIDEENTDEFESNNVMVQWQTSSTNSLVSSWERGIPDNTETSLDSAKLPSTIWTTGLNRPYNPGETSFLYSPAYDLSQLSRPKVSFDYVSFMGGNDGVVLEFSTDNLNITDPAKKWYRLGTNVDGNNWYSKSGLASSPGDQTDPITGFTSGDFGWSTKADTVLHAQHTLSPDIPAGARTQVIFRFALAAYGLSSEQGFAFDRFRVGERTRIVLIENFTNAGNTTIANGRVAEKFESDFLNDPLGPFAGVGTDVVKINYHVSFPQVDPFNDDDPSDPSARALYYNINETPLARMDGGKPIDPQKKYLSDWGTAMYNIRTLKLAQAKLFIGNPTPSANGGFEFKVVVEASEPLAKNNTILHIAFVESSIPLSGLTTTDQGMVTTGQSTFEYVLKKMIPSALGSRLDIDLAKGESKEFGPFVWNPDLGKLYNAPNDLALIAFIQNEATKEIYQTEILTGLTDPALVTGVEDPDYVDKIQLFPNPANHEVNIQLPAAVSKSTPVEMFDTHGKTVYRGSFKGGEQIKTISTSELTGGVYLIQLSTPDGKIARRKIMVVHR